MADNLGKKVRASNEHGVVLVGIVTGEAFVGEVSSVRLDLLGTGSTVEVDYDEFTWEVIDGRA